MKKIYVFYQENKLLLRKLGSYIFIVKGKHDVKDSNCNTIGSD